MQKLYTHAHVYTRVNARSPSAGVPKLLFDAHAPRRIEVNEKIEEGEERGLWPWRGAHR
jgi:hypothetical protein